MSSASELALDDGESLLNGDNVESMEEEEDEEGEERLKAEPCQCLFCECEQSSATAALDHCKAEHGVDLTSIAAALGVLPCLLQRVNVYIYL